MNKIPCYIKKNSAKLRKILDSKGYKYGGHDDFTLCRARNMWLYCANGIYSEIYPDIDEETESNSINCGKSEDLFLDIIS